MMTTDQLVTRGREVADEVKSRAKEIAVEALDLGGKVGAVHYLSQRLAWLERDMAREERHVARLEALLSPPTTKEQGEEMKRKDDPRTPDEKSQDDKVQQAIKDGCFSRSTHDERRRSIEKARLKKKKWPKTCGKCGSVIHKPGPCPTCNDEPYGRPF